MIAEAIFSFLSSRLVSGLGLSLNVEIANPRDDQRVAILADDRDHRRDQVLAHTCLVNILERELTEFEIVEVTTCCDLVLLRHKFR